MKITMVLDLLIEAVSLRSAWLISRACRPGWHVAHLAFELGARHQRRDRIDHQHVDRAGAHQRVGDLQRLLAGVGLRDQEVVDIDAELARIDRIERVLGIDEGADAALLLRLGDAVQRERGLAGGFRPVDLDHAPARQAADAERDVEAERAGGDRLDVHRLVVLAEPHDRALAEIALDLGERGIKGLRLVHGRTFNETKRWRTHCRAPYDRDSGDRQRGPRRRPQLTMAAMYTICSRFAICSCDRNLIFIGFLKNSARRQHAPDCPPQMNARLQAILSCGRARRTSRQRSRTPCMRGPASSSGDALWS